MHRLGPQPAPEKHVDVSPIARVGFSWYAVISKPQHEKTVACGLEAKGFETFLPTFRSRRIWSDRVKELDQPLFAGYVFSRFDPEIRTPILRTPGVRSIVQLGKLAAPIPDAEIEAIRTLVDLRLHLEPWPFIREGQRVRIERGPLQGVEGIILKMRDTWRLVLSVELLQRSVSVEIDSHSVRPV